MTVGFLNRISPLSVPASNIFRTRHLVNRPARLRRILGLQSHGRFPRQPAMIESNADLHQGRSPTPTKGNWQTWQNSLTCTKFGYSISTSITHFRSFDLGHQAHEVKRLCLCVGPNKLASSNPCRSPPERSEVTRHERAVRMRTNSHDICHCSHRNVNHQPA
jgi:hypothetical protein